MRNLFKILRKTKKIEREQVNLIEIFRISDEYEEKLAGERHQFEQFTRKLCAILLGKEATVEEITCYSSQTHTLTSPLEVLNTLLTCEEYNRKILIDKAAAIGLTEKDVAFMESFSVPDIKPMPGFITDFMGSKVRTSFMGMWGEGLDGVVCSLPIPGGYTGEAGEWFGTFKAVAAAKESFSVMELGAGYGAWLGISGVAALNRGITDIYLCGVEADPVRASWMSQHLIDNGLDRFPYALFSAGVGVENGTARWPRLVDPANVTGARPLRNDNEADQAYLQVNFDLGDMIDIEIVSFSSLLERRRLWDLIHMDVQGAEVELCRACAALLTERARYLVVGTHWRSLDGDLLELMLGEGWILEYEQPTTMKLPAHPSAASLFHHTIVDGVQIWRNPRID